MANVSQVEREIEDLKRFIRKLGSKNEEGKYQVTFGVLFDDDEAANTFEAMVGTLRSAKKRKIIKFKGQMLLKGMHDNVPITLLVDNDGGDDTSADIVEDVPAAVDTEPVIEANTDNIEDDIADNNNNNKEENEVNEEAAQTNEPKEEHIVAEVEDDNKINMVEIHGRCNESGCKCDKYIENPSKWSKGKCMCDHTPNRHKKQWVKAETVEEDSAKAEAAVAVVEVEQEAEQEEDEEVVLDNKWGEEFTGKLGECVNDTFDYDGESILAAKYLLHYLKKHIGFDFSEQSQHRDALQYVFVEKFGRKAINSWGYNVRVL